ncbi:phosphoribosylformylglycinamidinesynthase, partial [Monoraphidium neglectum]
MALRVGAVARNAPSSCRVAYAGVATAGDIVRRRVACRVASQPREVVRSDSVQSKLTAPAAAVVQLYRYPGLSTSAATTLLHKAQAKASDIITSVDGEVCFNVQLSAPLTPKEAETLAWLLRETFEPELLTPSTVLLPGGPTQSVVEVGPRSSFQTAWCTNALSICASVGLGKVVRLEQSRRYLLTSTRPLDADDKRRFAAL